MKETILFIFLFTLRRQIAHLSAITTTLHVMLLRKIRYIPFLFSFLFSCDIPIAKEEKTAKSRGNEL